MKKDTEPLKHFALRTDDDTINELMELAYLDDRKLRTMANMALKEGIKVIRKRINRTKR